MRAPSPHTGLRPEHSITEVEADALSPTQLHLVFRALAQLMLRARRNGDSDRCRSDEPVARVSAIRPAPLVPTTASASHTREP